MSTDNCQYDCPACGFEQEFPPWVGDSPSHEICPCCGIQFGYQDLVYDRDERARIYERWRSRWVAEGMAWRGVGYPPSDWDPAEQLQGLSDCSSVQRSRPTEMPGWDSEVESGEAVFFSKSEGRPTEYHGEVLQMWDRVIIGELASIRLVFESVDSHWRQGVNLKAVGIRIAREDEETPEIVLWQDAVPREVAAIVSANQGVLRIRNVWDRGDGIMQCWTGGGAMIVEDHGTWRRYLCNDGHPDDDFDDLIFSIHFD